MRKIKLCHSRESGIPLFLFCLLFVSFTFGPRVSAQTIKYTDIDGQVFTGKIKVSQAIKLANNKTENIVSADFNTELGIIVYTDHVTDWKPEKPDFLPIIKAKWVTVSPAFFSYQVTEERKLKSEGFSFIKKSGKDFSGDFDITVRIGYGNEDDDSPQGTLKAVFHNRPKKPEPETEPEPPSTKPISQKDTKINTGSNNRPTTPEKKPNKEVNTSNTNSQPIEKEEPSGIKDDTSSTGNISQDPEDPDPEESESITEIPLNPEPRTQLPLWVQEQPEMVLIGLFSIIILLVFILLSRKKSPSSASDAKEILPKTSIPAPEFPKAENRVKIKEKKKAVIEEAQNFEHIPFSQLAQSTGVQTFDLESIWKKTIVKKVFMLEKPAGAINDFVQEKNISSFSESDGLVPEIAGFLLGRFNQLENSQYEVVIDEFLPITAGDQGVYKVEFGTHAWIELDAVQEKFPKLTTIGWFHTHPGHGLFLSQPDLNIQNGFFRQPYQLAMEIDPLKERQDMAFFTWSDSNTMNNSAQRLTDQWFSWQEIVTSM